MTTTATLVPGELGLTDRPTPAWTGAHVRGILSRSVPEAPLIAAEQARPILPGFDVWDMWPLARLDGGTARIDGGRLWFALAAPVSPDPEHRHNVARIRLLHEVRGNWRDGGDALPNDFTSGSREWSGSALLQPEGAVQLFFTAAGRRGEARISFEQRLFQTVGQLDLSGSVPRLVNWTTPDQMVSADDDVYTRVVGEAGEPGTIKARKAGCSLRKHLALRGSTVWWATVCSALSAF